jgi:hypothetical protein
MDIADSQEVATRIVDLLGSAVNRQMTGVRLGVEIRNAFPYFSPTLYRCKNLRQFITMRVPLVKELGQSGPDVLYGLAGEEGPAPTRWKVPTPAWRTFTNPHPRYALYANPGTFQLTTFHPTACVEAPWVRVPSSTEEAHVQIARDFIATVPELLQQPLEKALLESKWWFAFVLEARQAGLYQQWSVFRHRELWKLLLSTLDGLPGGQQPSTPPADLQASTNPGSRVTGVSPQPLSTGADARLRQVVLTVIGKMATEDLKQLRLPVGDVLDAIAGE